MSKPFFKTFIGNLLIVGILSVALYWLFFGSLSLITKHNDVKVVPELKGKSLKEAFKLLEQNNFEIEVDSVYDETLKPLTIIDQLPLGGSTVKTGRKIVITVNKAIAPLISLPNFNGMSLRTALLSLKRNDLEIGDTTYVYDISYNTILEMKINGKFVKPGTKVPAGTRIDFVISAGLSDTRVKIPYLLGKTYAEAVKELNDLQLRYQIGFDEPNLDTAEAKVYYQAPQERNDYGEPQYLYQGELVDLRFKKNPEIPKRTFIQRSTYDQSSYENFDNLHNQNLDGGNDSNTTPINNNPTEPRPNTNPNNVNPTAPVRPQRGNNPPTEPKTTTPTQNPKPESQPKENKPKENKPKENKPLRPTRN